MIRRQSVCVILDDIQPQPMFEEVFVAIADLGETLLPDVSLTATPWLFQDLTETLDKRVLSSVSRHDDGSFTHDFSLNLNVSTILSEDFRNFDYNIRSGMKSSIVLELQPIDIFSDLTSYLLARDYAQNLGYKICIDGVTDKSLRFIDRERLGADLLKLVWTPELPEAIESDPLLQDRLRNMGANRAILCRVDDEHAPALKTGLTRDQAFDLLKKYNEDPFHIAHGQTLEGLMRYYAQKYDPANVEFWGQVGLLHDLDWEKFQDEVQHTVKAAELIEEAGGSKELARAIQTHNSDNNPDLPAPSCKMECVLFACDELSGLIQAAVLMRPSKSVMDFELKSLKKKFKDKRFAAGCDRDVIRRGAELNGMELDDLFASVIEAMKAIQPTCEGVE